MNIKIANTDEEIKACFPVMQALRIDLVEEAFVEKIRNQQKSGYILAYVENLAKPVAVAGFRVNESLSWKRYLYADDLVTLTDERSKGYGAALLNWLTEYAQKEGCSTFHLDSGIQRKDAHRFYEREGLQLVAYHFAKQVTSSK